MTDYVERSAASGRSLTVEEIVQREVAAVMRALAPMGGTKEQSDACIALGRLAAWSEAGLTPRFGIEVQPAQRPWGEVDH